MCKSGHFVYMLKCSDGTFYTGYTKEITRRIKEHNESPKGAKYTRGRRPVQLVYMAAYQTRSEALKYEHALKRKPRLEKEKLVKAFTKILDD